MCLASDVPFASRPHRANGRFIPSGLLLQWHLTERCQLRCEHCYQGGAPSWELPWGSMLNVLQQYEELLAEWRQEASERAVWGQITLTGGEPLLHAGFWELAQELSRRSSSLRFAVLTNGHEVDETAAAEFERLRPLFVQVSLEGGEHTHDAIRGQGSYRRVLHAIRLLRARGVRTLVAFTAHQRNYREFPQVVKAARELGVTRVWADRWIPPEEDCGSSLATLTPDQTQDFLQIMKECRTPPLWGLFDRTEVALHRALQFLEGGGHPYRCTAGESLLALLPNGDVYPCRRMPVLVGNVMKTPLRDLYYQSSFLNRLRDPSRVSIGCEKCVFRWTCRGGLRCLSQACHGDPHHRDPGCPVVATSSENRAESALPRHGRQ